MVRIDPRPPTDRLSKAPSRQPNESRRQTTGFAQSRDGTFQIDFINKLITITDTQSPAQVRVKIGLLGAAANNYGIEVLDQNGRISFRAHSAFAQADLVSLTLRTTVSTTRLELSESIMNFFSSGGTLEAGIDNLATRLNIFAQNSKDLRLTVAGTKELQLLADVAHTGGKFGAYSTTPVVRPTVTGSRAGNAALASLLTALAGIGWIIDSSSA